MTKKWTVSISFMSLAEGEVGGPCNKKPIRREHNNPVEALLDLEKSIETNEGDDNLIAGHKVIITPDNRSLAFDTAYTEVFGVLPVHRDNKENLYPALRKAAKKTS